MLKYLAKRIGRSILTLFIIVTLVFCLLRLMPVEGYFANYEKMTEAQIQAGLQSMGLLDPLPVQIGRFWVNMLHGDLGVSHIYKVNASVTSILAKKLPISIQMGVYAMLLSLVIGIPMGLTSMSNSVSISDTFAQLPQTFGVIFTKDGFPALFSDVSRLPIILLTIFAFSMSDTFDTIGTFIGTGRRTGIFSAEDEKALENGSGFSSKMDKALFADSIATSIGAICGTSNTTTYVESSAGIAAGGRTGLTSVVVAICFALSAFLSPVISAVPSAATAGVLVVVGCMMASSLKEIEWGDISEAIPAFFASVFMAFSYSISYGIAGGFITYCIVKTCKKQAKDVHPVIWVVAVLFILDFIITAVL